MDSFQNRFFLSFFLFFLFLYIFYLYLIFLEIKKLKLIKKTSNRITEYIYYHQNFLVITKARSRDLQ